MPAAWFKQQQRSLDSLQSRMISERSVRVCECACKHVRVQEAVARI